MVTIFKYKHKGMHKVTNVRGLLTRRIEHRVSRIRGSNYALSATPFGIVFAVQVFEDNCQFLTDRPSECGTL